MHVKLRHDVGEIVGRLVIVPVILNAKVNEWDLRRVKRSLIGLVGPVVMPELWVVVAEHPFYALSNDQGEFVLGNVPPGRYSLQLWQEALGKVARDVTVGDGITAVTVEMTGK